MNILNGYKTWFGLAGGVGYIVYLASQGDYQHAMQAGWQVLVMLGIASKIQRIMVQQPTADSTNALRVATGNQ